MKWDNMFAVVIAVSLGYLTSRSLTHIIACLERLLSILYGKTLYSTLQGKHVVVTGGSSGIGYAIAKRALEDGASVTLVARNVEKLQKAKASLLEESSYLLDAVHVKSADVSDAIAITAAIRDSQERKPIDILVCNAGVIFPGLIDEVSATELEDTVKANLLGTVYPIHAAIPLMKSCGPRTPKSIVLVSSVAGLHQSYGANVYSPTKYAQRGLAENLRWELLPCNIHMHVVCPRFVDTPMLQAGEANSELAKISREMNFFNPDHIATANHVAKCTWAGVRRGRFLITTDWVGHLLAVVSRGPIPEDSIATDIWELLLILPVRLLGFVLKGKLTQTIRRLVTIPSHTEISNQ